MPGAIIARFKINEKSIRKTSEIMPSSRLFYALFTVFIAACSVKEQVEHRTLRAGWEMISSEELAATGREISSATAQAGNWINVKLPATVLGAMVEASVVKDPFFGKNLEAIPRGPFEVPWWFRTSFDLKNLGDNEVVHLYLDGINYRANIWLNGAQIASQDTLFGAFRQFALQITDRVQKENNILAIEIIPPKPRDFYMGFVDWAPTPPDHYMGIFRDVRLKRSGPVTMDYTFVAPDVNTETLASAELSISTELTNNSEKKQNVTVVGTIGPVQFEKNVELQPGEMQEVFFTPGEFEQLQIDNPRLWWPNGLGSQEMYTLNLTARLGSTTSDSEEVRFGIRKIETYMNDSGVRGYKVNGRPVLIKSGGWVDDLFLRYQPEKDSAQIRYVKEMNMNSLRFEGVWGNNHHIYDLCDENGILLMVGWSCQWEWPDYLGLKLEIPEEDQNLPINEGVDLYSVKLTPDEEELLSDYFRDQVKWLRNHPSIYVWAAGSDAMPKPSLESKYLQTMQNFDPTRSCLVSAGEFTSEISGPTGMKMNGPYEYVPPVYWYEDKKLGGAFGFNSETGPGPQIPPIESIKKMIPEEHLWPPANDMWNYHSGRKDFNSVTVYLTALNNRYGKPDDLEELAYKAQLMNYEAIRPMFEAFVVNKPTATGVVQWMLNSPWPEFYWQLYDYYLMPTGAYFGTKKACQPLNIMYNYDNNKIHVSNDTGNDLIGVRASVRMFDEQSQVTFEKSVTIDMPDNVSMELLELPELHTPGSIAFVDMSVAHGESLSGSNFYWLSSTMDKMDWDQYFWFYTPQKQFADFTPLNNLQKANLEAAVAYQKHDGENAVQVTLKNPSDHIAFFVELKLVHADNQQPVLPAYWDDNYVSVLPGNSVTVQAKYSGDTETVVKIQGINLEQRMTL
jgi:exo-1,4-beta-D-glucosaminidase